MSAPGPDPGPDHPAIRLLPLALIFTLNGTVLASWVVRVPAAKDQVHASTGELGVALLFMSLGALVAMSLAGHLCVRFGVRRVMVVTSLALCPALTLPSLAGSVLQLGAALLVLGAINGTCEVSLNSAAAEFETKTARSVMSPLHGLWSFGGLLGALAGGVSADSLSIRQHLGLVAAVVLVLALALAPFLLRSRAEARPEALSGQGSASARASPGALSLLVVLFGVIALCTAYGEGAVSDWGALHLRENLGTSAGVAAFGFAAYSVAIAAARLTGGLLISRLGRTPVLVGGSFLAAAGILIAAWATEPPVAFAGFMAVGLGLANVFPIAIARAGALGGPKAVGTASTLGYTGMLAGPPFIGFLADRVGLPGALSTVTIFAVLAATLGIALRERGTPAPSGSGGLGGSGGRDLSDELSGRRAGPRGYGDRARPPPG